MRRFEAIIVGGGPAGAACAARLVRAGVACGVLDRVDFPRHKTCAGWITPGVLDCLGIQPGEYPHRLTRFSSLKIYLNQLGFRRPGIQYAILRYEFDDWLLRRSGADLIRHDVKDIQEMAGGYVIDGQFSAEYLVGAGGNHCPVFRTFFQGKHDRTGSRILALECEYALDWVDPDCRLWFMRNRLPGYAWYVPKTGGIANIGVGGNAQGLEERGSSIRDHWDFLVDLLWEQKLITNDPPQPQGYAYYLRGRNQRLQLGKAYLVGDAAGLATLDMGEGIGPAIRSGQLAAEAIIERKPYSPDSISSYSLLPKLFRWLLWENKGNP